MKKFNERFGLKTSDYLWLSIISLLLFLSLIKEWDDKTTTLELEKLNIREIIELITDKQESTNLVLPWQVVEESLDGIDRGNNFNLYTLLRLSHYISPVPEDERAEIDKLILDTYDFFKNYYDVESPFISIKILEPINNTAIVISRDSRYPDSTSVRIWSGDLVIFDIHDNFQKGLDAAINQFFYSMTQGSAINTEITTSHTVNIDANTSIYYASYVANNYGTPTYMHLIKLDRQLPDGSSEQVYFNIGSEESQIRFRPTTANGISGDIYMGYIPNQELITKIEEFPDDMQLLATHVIPYISEYLMVVQGVASE